MDCAWLMLWSLLFLNKVQKSLFFFPLGVDWCMQVRCHATHIFKFTALVDIEACSWFLFSNHSRMGKFLCSIKVFLNRNKHPSLIWILFFYNKPFVLFFTFIMRPWYKHFIQTREYSLTCCFVLRQAYISGISQGQPLPLTGKVSNGFTEVHSKYLRIWRLVTAVHHF